MAARARVWVRGLGEEYGIYRGGGVTTVRRSRPVTKNFRTDSGWVGNKRQMCGSLKGQQCRTIITKSAKNT